MAMEKIRNEKEPDERYQLIKKPRSRRQAHNERMAFAINDDEERLAIDMFKDYNRLIHPLPCGNKTSIVVDFGIALILLINIDEKNQVMQTNVWLTLAWNDCQFNWNPSDYGGIESLRVAIDRIWQPDVVLFNNCDGMYETSYLSNAVVDYKGDITWVPPAIFKSFCRIDVEFFPFDEQVCTLIFGSWTYQDEIKFNWYGNKRSVELNDYSTSSIWDLIAAPGELVDKQSRVHFQIVIRRKSLFYSVILICPTVLMSFLNICVFYLPAECNEKISLTTSLLLAIVVFLLLVSKLLPPTSDKIPLMAKYLLFTFVLNIITIMSTVIVINVYFRSDTTHQLPKYAKTLFLEFLPRILLMERPARIPVFNGFFVEEYNAEEIFDASLLMPSIAATMLPFSNLGINKNISPKVTNESSSQNKFFKGKTSFGNLRKTLSMKKVGNIVLKRNTTMSMKKPLTSLDNKFPKNGSLKNVSFSMNEFNDKFVPSPSFSFKYDGNEEESTFINSPTLNNNSIIRGREPHPSTAYATNSGPNGKGCFNRNISILCSEDETRLVQDLFRNYNHLVRPVPNTTTGPLEVEFSLAMVLLISISEKIQVMHTNVWLTLEWDDYQMSWDPTKYGKLSTIRLPPDRTWHPEIVLFNNADGQYEVSFYSNVVVSRFGRMLWVPPAIYKSSCQIEVEFFPFDEQVCSLIFGSWTYNEREVILKHKDGVRMVDLSDYSYSGIWDIVSADGELIQKKSKISYQIKIRRKPLFYSVILLIPTILMAFLSIFVLYLPTESSEKITLAISLLLALVVFLLLTSKILPPTSSTIPLLAKYLLLTFVLNIITILVTVVIINIYFRRPTTHTMNFWVRIVFLKYLPILLMMRKPTREKCIKVSKKRKTMSGFTKQSDRNDSKLDTTRSYIPGEFIEMSSTKIHRPSSGTTTVPNIYNYDKLENNRTNGEPMQETNLSAVPSTSKLSSSLSTFQKVNLMSDEKSVRMRYTSEDIHSILSEDALKAITAVEYITEHLKQENQYKKVRDEWKFIATCLDRLLMYIFFAVTVGATIGILLSAPNIFDNVDQAEIIARLQAQAQNEKNNL
uniref:Neur_chan_LBD domain-containing protein n=1 Tax=Rhabditophanes sp. KR3021 TaxID=114890 RepID=A0AC35TTI2_9BILA